MEDGESRRDMVLAVMEKYGCREEKAEVFFDDAEQVFLRQVGFSKPQIRNLIHKRAMKTLANDESTGKEVTDATRSLTQVFNLKEEKASENKAREARLWKDLIDLMDFDEQDRLYEQFESDAFEIDDINESAVEAKRALKKKGRKR